MSEGPWGYVAGRLLALLFVSALFGYLFGQPLAWLSAALLAYLGWHLWHLWQLESWLRRKLGEPPRDAAGLWGGVFAQLHRLRLQSRARKKRLARVLKEFRKSTQALPDAGVVLDKDNAIVWLNEAATRLLGLRPADRGQRIENLLRAPEFAAFLRAARTDSNLRMASPPDEAVKLSLQVVPYGETQHLLLAKDITHEVRLETVRRTFVANASHELRSPLTVISGYLDSLAGDPELADYWREPVDEMARQSERMRRIIEDLLTLSRLEASAPEAERDYVDVAAMLTVLRKEALARPQRPGVIELHLDTEAGLLGVESEIYSAFANLIGNALKYTPTDGRVSIRWRMEGEEGWMSVEDDGIGIPAEAIPRLTERFYRVHKGRDRTTGGTGLGLAIVKHVLQRHGGRLAVESKIGAGSRFTCRFPPGRIAAGPEATDGHTGGDGAVPGDATAAAAGSGSGSEAGRAPTSP
ncbi:phosphate regulon sensor histidine kinase PhoR [Wenzhouxiangella sp. XN24]|uniref:phosphate regulon sensor histidine kinase PhoR n=1 Tax=Wenzhouxiangella sp. XN24 TaxID=2713569 RepID=UPI0013EDFAD8|nr:phosphate regulon sensor histidine kinase PhoR [Wenzhouxiangella sp. XN24]